jgi:hypothetical protein
MNADPFNSILIPILRDLRDYLAQIVVIGGWVPELHRRFGETGEWVVKPLGTTEVDMLIVEAESSGEAPIALGQALAEMGFSPVGRGGTASAVWERNVSVGERIEFFVDSMGPWGRLSTIQVLEPDTGLGGIRPGGLGVLHDHAISLAVPVSEIDGCETVARVQVPELGAFAIHKGAIFPRRSDAARMAKDLHYLVDLMQSGEAQVDTVERQLAEYCADGGAAAELARQAKNQIGVVIRRPAAHPLRQMLASTFAERHGTSLEEADAKARGFLTDFEGLIPSDCSGLTQ